MNWIPPLCVVVAIAAVVPWFVWLEERRRHRDQPTRITVTRKPNVTVLDTYRPGSNVRRLHREAR